MTGAATATKDPKVEQIDAHRAVAAPSCPQGGPCGYGAGDSAQRQQRVQLSEGFREKLNELKKGETNVYRLQHEGKDFVCRPV